MCAQQADQTWETLKKGSAHAHTHSGDPSDWTNQGEPSQRVTLCDRKPAVWKQGRRKMKGRSLCVAVGIENESHKHVQLLQEAEISMFLTTMLHETEAKSSATTSGCARASDSSGLTTDPERPLIRRAKLQESVFSVHLNHEMTLQAVRGRRC